MKLFLLVDMAYAFDYISIVAIKGENNPSLETLSHYFDNLDCLRVQLGEELLRKVHSSNEYMELKKANKSVFDLVERVRKGEKIDAKEIDDGNMLRFYKKKALQDKFFVGKLAETKT